MMTTETERRRLKSAIDKLESKKNKTLQDIELLKDLHYRYQKEYIRSSK